MASIRTALSRTSTRVVLGTLLLLIAIGLIAWDSDPLLALQLRLARHDRPTYATQLRPGVKPLRGGPKGNRLVIDSVSIDAGVYGGTSSAKPLAKGVWLQPQGSTPGNGSEPVIIAGHRTTHHFATLHLVSRGDPVIVYWNGHEYDYKVTNVHSIGGSSGLKLQKDAPGTGERLVMYTCLPRWQGDKRYVVVATPINPKKK